MRNLLGFLIKISPLLLFLFLEIVAVVLMVQRSRYHEYVLISTSNVVSGGVLDLSNSVSSYFSLSSVNEELALENSELKNEILRLQERLSAYRDSEAVANISFSDSSVRIIKHIPAKVISNSVNRLDNYVTLDKGSKDGVEPDMGVVCSQGVVGIVSTVSDHFCVVLPIINSQSRISCRLDSSKVMGSLVWNGIDPSFASLIEVPRHVSVTEGEKIYTSGFSYIFPEFIPAGVVEKVELDPSDSFYRIKVRLTTSFYSLSFVDIISFSQDKELEELESVTK